MIHMTRVYDAASVTSPIAKANQLFLRHQIVLVLLWSATALVVYGTLSLAFELRLFVVLAWVVGIGIAFGRLSRANHRLSQAIYEQSVGPIHEAYTETVSPEATPEPAPEAVPEPLLADPQQQDSVDDAAEAAKVPQPEDDALIAVASSPAPAEPQPTMVAASQTRITPPSGSDAIVAEQGVDALFESTIPDTARTDESSMGRHSGIVSTGDSQLDEKLGGGVPEGSLTLIDGESGAGKSILAQHFILGSLNSGRRVVLYSSENTERTLVSQMDGLGMRVSDYLANGSLTVHEIPASNTGGEAPAPVRLQTLLTHVSQLGDWDLVVMDSVTELLVSASDEDRLSFFSSCKQYQNQGKTVIIVVHANAISGDGLVSIVSICDVYLRLRIEVVNDKRVKLLEVEKVRGAKGAIEGIIGFEVEAGLGIVTKTVMTKLQG